MVKRILSNNKIRFAIYCVLFVMIITIHICWISSSVQRKSLDIKNGVWDASVWNRNYSFNTLNGEWEFYWKQLLYKNDFINNPIPDAIVNVPSVWNKYKISGNKLPGYGYATFRLHVVNAKMGKKIAMRISPLSTSYRMYIDNQLVAENGTVGMDKDSSKPEYKVQTFVYTPVNSNYDIILQVSNYTYARGGVWYIPQIGTPEEINQYTNIIWCRDVFFLGCFALMLLFSFTLFTLLPYQKSSMYFSIMCACIIGRTIIYSSYLITSWPILSSLNIIVRLDYICLSWFATALLLLTHSQFSKVVNEKFIKVITIASFIFTFYVLLTPIHIFTQSIYLLEAANISLVLYCLIVHLKKIIEHEKDILLSFFALLFFFLTGIHDLFLQNNYISGGSIEYMPFGFFILLLCEEIIIVKKYSNVQNENERTRIEIEEISERERKIELKFLKSQIKPHFIHNALNTIISISRINPEESRDLLVEFSRYLRSCFDFENLENLVPLEKEIEFVYSYIAIEKARFGNDLNVIYEIDDVNIMIPPLILQPIVENAVIHGIRQNNKKGEIFIYIKKINDGIVIGVKDNGVGIKDNELEDILHNADNSRGVGLYNINQRINKLYGTNLKIETIHTGGTNIYMDLPYISSDNDEEHN